VEVERRVRIEDRRYLLAVYDLLLSRARRHELRGWPLGVTRDLLELLEEVLWG